jgi:antirestriction protein ArdC
MPSQSELRSNITSQIVAALEQGTIPWRRPWRKSPNSGRPANCLSRRAYSGINPLLLELHAHKHGFQSRWWGTYQQWERWGCQVKRRPEGVDPGGWGCKIVFYKPITKTMKNDEAGDEDKREFFVMRTFSVFNAEQVTGPIIDRFLVPEQESESNVFPDFRPFQELVVATKADIRHEGELALYERPKPYIAWPNHTDGDYIMMPTRDRFDSVAAYYETLGHEMAHWAEIRLDWLGSYAMGELIAELSATYLCAEIGVPCGDDLTNHASYLQSWITAMQGDSSFIFKASTQASKVTDFLLAFVKKVQPQPEQVEVV